MLTVEIDEEKGVAFLGPDGPLSENDFKSAAKVIDQWIEKNGELNGLIIHAKSFPGWESFAALSSHLIFIKEHHKKIARIALVSDSYMAGIAEKIANHFMKAEIKSFPFQDMKNAKLWVTS